MLLREGGRARGAKATAGEQTVELPRAPAAGQADVDYLRAGTPGVVPTESSSPAPHRVLRSARQLRELTPFVLTWVLLCTGVIGRIPAGTVEDVEAAVAAAVAAHKTGSWARSTGKQRAVVLRAIAEKVCLYVCGVQCSRDEAFTAAAADTPAVWG